MSFASQGDLAEKTITFAELADGVYAYTAEGDPNSGVIVGDDGVMVVDATATPVMAKALIERIRKVTDKPIKYVLLTHYHAVRVMGASAFGAEQIIASDLDPRADRGARPGGLRERGQPLPAPVPGGRERARPDLADHDLRDLDDRLARPAPGRDQPSRPRPHQGRHDRLAARGAGPVQRRSGRVRRRALHWRCLSHRLAGDARAPARARCREAGPRPGRGADQPGRRGGRDRRHPRFRRPRCSTASSAASPRASR